jgi:hypothetical protein
MRRSTALKKNQKGTKMSLYYLQKVLFELNRDPSVQSEYLANSDELFSKYTLTQEEQRALKQPDIGLLYVLGVNGQILMHFAAFHQIEWDDYLRLMREGVQQHGAVRDGVYAMTGEGINFTLDSEAK